MTDLNRPNNDLLNDLKPKNVGQVTLQLYSFTQKSLNYIDTGCKLITKQQSKKKYQKYLKKYQKNNEKIGKKKIPNNCAG